MNYFDAIKLLNEVRNGINHSAESITYALFLTGDIPFGDGSSGVDQAIQCDEIRPRPDSRIVLVGSNDTRH